LGFKTAMLKKLALGFCLVCAAAPARAEVFMENLTWMGLRDQISQGSATVIVPIGGTEQNGPHMTLGKHNARVKFLAGRIAETLAQTLVAPTMAYVPEGEIDPPTAHMKFPGTLSLKDATFIAVLKETGRSLHHAGFRNVVFIGDHGSYQKDLTVAAEALTKEWAGKGRALGLIQYYALAQEPYNDTLRAAGLSDAEIGTHASGADTSLELATAPDMVRLDKMKDEKLATPTNGVYGAAPLRASAALGQKGVDLIVAGTVSAIKSGIGVQ
jgi:creatinine amidohydrolase